MTAFVVERGTEGFKAGKKEDKLGMRASETAEVFLKTVVCTKIICWELKERGLFKQ